MPGAGDIAEDSLGRPDSCCAADRARPDTASLPHQAPVSPTGPGQVEFTMGKVRMKPKHLREVRSYLRSKTARQWLSMNRKKRREMMRKIQSDDLSLEVLYPDVAGIDSRLSLHRPSFRRIWHRTT